MVEEARVVVIGSGGFGASTAYHLARRGARDVVLLDRHAIGSQTSPRAAGLTSLHRLRMQRGRPVHLPGDRAR